MHMMREDNIGLGRMASVSREYGSTVNRRVWGAETAGSIPAFPIYQYQEVVNGLRVQSKS